MCRNRIKRGKYAHTQTRKRNPYEMLNEPSACSRVPDAAENSENSSKQNFHHKLGEFLNPPKPEKLEMEIIDARNQDS
jgi:hypothetical protein